MRIATVIGTRPQAIKSILVSQALSNAGHEEFVINTGQHYDDNMWDSMFRCLGVKPVLPTNELIEEVQDFRPDILMVYGDTDSTLQGVTVASKLSLPLAHVEAGLRSHNLSMKEEVNRTITGYSAALNLCPTESALNNLKLEGLDGLIVGDPLFDSFIKWQGKALARKLIVKFSGYALMTVHRKENMGRLDSILKHAQTLDTFVVWPVHPRVRGIRYPSFILPIAPVNYLDMLGLIQRADVIMTDSGGVQREAFWAGKDCIVLRDVSEWDEICTTPGAPENIVRCLEEYNAGF